MESRANPQVACAAHSRNRTAAFHRRVAQVVHKHCIRHLRVLERGIIPGVCSLSQPSWRKTWATISKTCEAGCQQPRAIAPQSNGDDVIVMITTAEVRDAAYHRLKSHVIEATGLAYYVDKDDLLAAHFQRRRAFLGISDDRAYLELLHDRFAGQAEMDELTALLTIGETYFFRHEELFDALRSRVVPELIERNHKVRRLRVWSAGCANGAEPYSLSVLLRHDFGVRLSDWNVRILGTDVNRKLLAQARRGVYDEWALRSAALAERRCCFRREGDAWIVAEEYRRDVTFQYHNLVVDPIASANHDGEAFDLVLCRNVMIYFDPPCVRRLVERFYDLLEPGGWLAVGPFEPDVERFAKFETINAPGAVLYRKPLRSSTAHRFDVVARGWPNSRFDSAVLLGADK